MYYIINEIEIIDEELKYTPIGYTLNEEDRDTLNANYDNTLGMWLKLNVYELSTGIKHISDYFTTSDVIYSANTQTTSIEGMGLTEIIDISELT